MTSIVDSWWAPKMVRSNPRNIEAPFYDDRVDESQLVVRGASIRAYSPLAVHQAAKILVSRFRIPIHVAMALTETLAPAMAHKNLDVSIDSQPSPRRRGRRDLKIQLNGLGSGRIPEDVADDLRAVGFHGPENSYGRSRMIWSAEEDPR